MCTHISVVKCTNGSIKDKKRGGLGFFSSSTNLRYGRRALKLMTGSLP